MQLKGQKTSAQLEDLSNNISNESTCYDDKQYLASKSNHTINGGIVEVKVEPLDYGDDELTSDYTEEVEKIIRTKRKRGRPRKTENQVKKEPPSKKNKVGRPIKLKIKEEMGADKVKKETVKKPKVKKKEKELEPWVHVSLDQHPEMFKVEKIDSIERQHRRSVVFEFMYSCLLCNNFKAENKEVFEGHLEKHVNKVFRCTKCSYEAYSEHDLTKHRHACNTDKMFVCAICGETLPRRDMYRAHMGKAHGINHYKCRYCDERFPTRFNYLAHMRKEHFAEMKFCPKCKQYLSTLSKDEYESHCESCTGEFQCPECGKMFLGKMVLATHVKYIHKNVRSHQCHICPYSAKSSNMLRLHINAHKGRLQS